MSPAIGLTCTICDSPNANFCGRCHSTRYCSIECQHTDLPSHKLLCSQYASHTGRPNPSYKRAILFAPNENRPRFIWIECETVSDDEVPGTWERSKVREHLGGNVGGYDACPEYKLIQRNILRGRNLADSLVVICRDTFLIDGSDLNRSIVETSRGATGHTWKGPIVAMKKMGLGSDPTRYTDIDMQGFRDVVDYFIAFGDESVQDGEAGRDRRGKVRGVKINCQGDQRTFGAEVYSAVDVPKDHPVFSSPIVPISELVGMPVHTRKYPPDRLWKDNHTDSSYENEPATFLHRVSDPRSDGWGWATMDWRDDIGSVIAVRSDGQDVTTQEVEALCRFCQFKMQPLFENGPGGGLVEMTRAEVMAYMTPEGFREYCAEM